MVPQSEQTLENKLIKQLQDLEYALVTIKDEDDLLKNLKLQLSIHNNIDLSEKEFAQILNHLNKGNIIDRAHTLRDKMQLSRDDGSTSYIEFINQEHRCRNEYQVTQQVAMEGSYKNRFDVTILVNGLPLVQIELKRR
jgi:type I restriction enzyme R subunit